jgi:predicted aldo/keto reductase-like oxidoreductase
MYYKDFKGNKISTLGLGVMRLPSVEGNPDLIDREKGAEIIDRAIALGVNYFDTAHIYQKTDSEKFLGEVLKKYPRDSYFLATKLYGSKTRDISQTFAQQLERLQTDYVDMYLLHSLDTLLRLNWTTRSTR